MLSMRITSGPWISTSISPTLYPLPARLSARLTDTVDLPTPPLPLMTSILFLILPSERVIALSCWASIACWDSLDPQELEPPHE